MVACSGSRLRPRPGHPVRGGGICTGVVALPLDDRALKLVDENGDARLYTGTHYLWATLGQEQDEHDGGLHIPVSRAVGVLCV